MKPYKSRNRIFAGAAFCLVFLLLQACVTAPKKAELQEQNAWDAMDLVLVLPFQNMAKIYGEGEHVKSPLGDKYYLAGKIETDGEEYLNGKLLDLLEKQKDFKIISPEGREGGTFLSQNDSGAEPLIEDLIKKGRDSGADGVMVGYVYRYSERVGNSISVSAPASVVFELFMISAKSNSVVWSAGFSETQKSLSEDLFLVKKFFQRGGKWIKVDEMAGDALTAMIGDHSGK
jgi:hypothetical protein